MQLTYRGTSYDYTPPQVEMDTTSEVGQYRGLEWRFRNSQKAPVLQSSLNLVYRGVAYQTGQAEAVTAPEYMPVPTAAFASTEGLTVQSMARAMMTSHHKWIKNRQQSLLSRVAAEVGLEARAAS